MVSGAVEVVSWADGRDEIEIEGKARAALVLLRHAEQLFIRHLSELFLVHADSVDHVGRSCK